MAKIGEGEHFCYKETQFSERVRIPTAEDLRERREAGASRGKACRAAAPACKLRSSRTSSLQTCRPYSWQSDKGGERGERGTCRDPLLRGRPACPYPMSATVALFETKSVYPLGFTTTTSVRSPISKRGLPSRSLAGMKRPSVATTRCWRPCRISRRALINKGVALRHMRRFKEALECYDAANPSSQPMAASIMLNRGSVLTDMGRHGEAVQMFDEVLRIDPGAFMAHRNRGVACCEMGRFDEALKSFGSAEMLDQKDVEVPLGAGRTLLLAGRHSDALASYSRAHGLEPGQRRGATRHGESDASGRHARRGQKVFRDGRHRV